MNGTDDFSGCLVVSDNYISFNGKDGDTMKQTIIISAMDDNLDYMLAQAKELGLKTISATLIKRKPNMYVIKAYGERTDKVNKLIGSGII